MYNDSDLKKLKGHISIGHNRYSTFGKDPDDHAQPVHYQESDLALAHNGNLPTVSKLVSFLHNRGISTAGLNDSELMYKAIEHWRVKGQTLSNSIKSSFELFTGAFSLLVMSKNELVAVRDSFGIRPLCLGRLNGSYVFSSETCALNAIGATYLRDVESGEMVIVNKDGLSSLKLSAGNTKLDVFEFIYFARPDSVLLGKSVYEVRKKLGEQLAKEFAPNADIIIPVPDSAIPAALGYSQQSKIPIEHALVKNRYIHRTFIKPSVKQRTSDVRMKLNLIESVVKNKSIILIDDSIVRGTTAKRLVELVRSAGAKELHLLISSPPVLYPDYYGIDTPKQIELISATRTLKNLTEYIGADTVYYLSFDGMVRAIGVNPKLLCMSCFDGNYPIDIGNNKKDIHKFDKKI